MGKYDLNALGHEKFELLVQALIKVVIAPGATIFGAGPDGSREATYDGKAPYPSQNEIWDGFWVFQAKYHDLSRMHADDARTQVVVDIRSELKKVVGRYGGTCKNYILATNVPFTSVFCTGTHDKIRKEVIPQFLDTIPHIHYWAYDDLVSFLDIHPEVRRTYFPFPDDLLDPLRRMMETFPADLSELKSLIHSVSPVIGARPGSPTLQDESSPASVSLTASVRQEPEANHESMPVAQQVEQEQLTELIRLTDETVTKADSTLSQIGSFDETLLAELSDVLSCLSAAIGSSDRHASSTHGQLLCRRAVINYMLADVVRARSDFEQASDLLPEDPLVWRNLALCCWVLNDHDSAIKHMVHARSLPQRASDLDLLEADIRTDFGDPASAIQILENALLQSSTSPFALRYRITLIRAYDRDLQTTRAESELVNLEHVHPLSPEVAQARAEHCCQLGRWSEALDILEGNFQRLEGRSRTSMAMMLADLFIQHGGQDQYRRAIEILRPLITSPCRAHAARSYARALYLAREYEDCLDICRRLQESSGFAQGFSELEAAIYWDTENYAPCSEILLALSKKFPQRTDYILHYGLSLFRLGRVQEAIDALMQAESRPYSSCYDIANMGRVYSYVGCEKKALELAGKALEMVPGDPRLHINFLHAFHQVADVSEGIDPRLIETYRDTLEKFNERFPGHRGIEKKKVSTDPDEFKAEMLRMLEANSDRREEGERLYARERLPVSFLAQLAGRSILDAWGTVVSSRDMKLWSDSGAREQLTEEIATASKSDAVVLDLVALLTLRALGCLPMLPAAFRQVFLPQSAMDVLLGQVQVLQMSSMKGHMSIWSEQGKIFRCEIPSDVVKAAADRMKETIDFLSHGEGIDIVGRALLSLKNDSADNLEAISVLCGEEAHASISLARDRHLPIYADDLWIRRYARDLVGLKSFGTRALLTSLLHRRLLTEDQYHSHLLSLLSLNYHFIPVHAATLAYAVKRESFSRTEKSLAPFESLRDKENEEKSLIDLSIEFLRWLWMEGLLKETKEQWTDILLNVITHGRDRGRLLRSIHKRRQEVFPSILVPGAIKAEFERCLASWSGAQVII